MKKPTLVSLSLCLSLASFPVAAAIGLSGGTSVGSGASVGVGVPSVGVHTDTNVNGGVSATSNSGTSAGTSSGLNSSTSSNRTNVDVTADHEDSTDMRYADKKRHNDCAHGSTDAACVNASNNTSVQGNLKTNQNLQK